MAESSNIIFLHHSTGKCIYQGGGRSFLRYRHGVREWFRKYNRSMGCNYRFDTMVFPHQPYPWSNYPYDYWLIWVDNQGYQGQQSLEELAEKYDVIIWKHCFPVCMMQQDEESDVRSPIKTLDNYKLQYDALKQKMRQFPQTRFIVWTGAAMLETNISAEEGRRAKEFFSWVRDEWDEKNDNIFIWDFFQIEAGKGCFLKPEYAQGIKDPHPNKYLSRMAAPLFCRRIVDVIEGRGDESSVLGEDPIRA
jgi:hypothetical protein